jgi:hypothetical protein
MGLLIGRCEQRDGCHTTAFLLSYDINNQNVCFHTVAREVERHYVKSLTKKIVVVHVELCYETVVLVHRYIFLLLFFTV